MLEPKLFDELSKQVAAGLPRGVQVLQDDVKRNLESAFESLLGRLELVTREEFEVQRGVLLRTREKLERLEARVRELEAQLKPK
jgi:BMFP domain-containing protein YqiC